MRLVTLVSLGASAVLGLAALVVAKTVLPNQAAAKVANLAAQPVAGVPVVVAASALKYGDKVDAEHLRVIHVTPDAAPEGAFASVAAVLSEDHGGAPVVLTPIAAREPVLAAKLSGPGARPSVAAEITQGMRAYTIKVTDVSGVGGHALPGDRVDVVLLRDLAPSNPMHNYVSQVVLQDVRVLAIDLNADLSSDKPATPSTATLEVNVEDSQKLSVAADLGKLSLALRRTGAAGAETVTPVRTNVFVGGSGAPERVVVRRRAPPHAAASAPVSYGIQIVEGDGRRSGARPPPPPIAPPAAPAAATAAGASTTASAAAAIG